ncbi:acyl-CoA thioesterase [Georhizobium profundi]|uniref:Acyl-CoA thioesterase n=1 Tax=Georhizobium profundi TaxID=2341112 RepID=A0A3Q8XMQ7_9HYPH|nr:thioesterase family protein [Georhizobium profundi]AZN70151.1 acyl-CoA thioesterase [Georhizobium profundi]
MQRAEPRRREDYRLFRPLQTRWADNDAYGHMNNVVHYALFDTAINGWLIEKGLLDIHRGKVVGLVVETGCNYFSEMAFPDRVTAGIAVTRIGTSSVTYRIGLFRGDDVIEAAQGRFTHVYVDRESRRPQPLDARWRTILEEISL